MVLKDRAACLICATLPPQHHYGVAGMDSHSQEIGRVSCLVGMAVLRAAFHESLSDKACPGGSWCVAQSDAAVAAVQ